MCSSCETKGFNRRDVLRAAGLTAAGAAFAASGVRPALAAPKAPPTSLSPNEALQALKDGNDRYESNPDVCTLDLAQSRKAAAPHQAPWATILSCADSRVPPELIFGGLGVGQLFVARNAGNLADTATIGTIEYGSAVLGSPLIVVLGHQHCGAVEAACNVVTENATFPGSIGRMIEPIVPAAIAVRGEPGDFVDNAVRENAIRTARGLKGASTIISGLVDGGKVKIIAARYDLESGAVEFFSEA